MASLKYVKRDISEVFHLAATLVKVVEPEAINMPLILLSNFLISSSDTFKYAFAVLCLVLSSTKSQTPSSLETTSSILCLGNILTSKPHIEKSKFGLFLLYTETKAFSHLIDVNEVGTLL